MNSKHNWTHQEIQTLFDLPFPELLFKAINTNRDNFNPNIYYKSACLSVKTGACPEDCKYCPQSITAKTDIPKQPMLSLEQVERAVETAQKAHATHFCVVTAGRRLSDIEFQHVLKMITLIKQHGLAACASLGSLSTERVLQLETTGLDCYNHNLDSSPAYYAKIITTRTYQDRLDTLHLLLKSKIKLCCGGIVGMGESVEDRVSWLQQIANLPVHPHAVPLNLFVKMPGIVLENVEEIHPLDFIRTLAVARILMPKSHLVVAAGRQNLTDEAQAFCFLVGANTTYEGAKLAVTDVPTADRNKQLFSLLKITEYTK